MEYYDKSIIDNDKYANDSYKESINNHVNYNSKSSNDTTTDKSVPHLDVINSRNSYYLEKININK